MSGASHLQIPHGGPGLVRRIEQFIGGQRAAAAGSSGHQHLAAGDEGRGMPLPGVFHGPTDCPLIGRRVIDLGGFPPAVAAGHHDLAVGQQRGCMAVPGGGQTRRRGPGTTCRVIVFHSSKGMWSAVRPPGHQHFAVGQKGGGMPVASMNHITDEGPRIMDRRIDSRIENFDVGHSRTGGAIPSPHNQNPPILEEGRGMILTLEPEGAGV